MKKWTAWLLILTVAVAGCRPQASPASVTPTTAATLSAIPATVGTPAVDKDFNDPAETWCQSLSFEFGDFYCQGGELHLVAKGIDNIAAGDGGLGVFKNFILQAQMRLIGSQGAYGLAFRGNGDGSKGTRTYYIFQIHPDGKYRLIVWSQNGSITELIPWTGSTAIKQGETANLLEVVAQDTRLTLYANNQKLSSLTDTFYATGSVGPVALEEGHAAISVFMVWELPAVASVH